MGSEARFQILNGIIGGRPTFYPGYIKPSGEFVSPHLTAPIYVNHDNFGMGGGDANAKKKPSSLFELTIWGDKPCAVAAHWFTSGKKLTVRGRMEAKKLAVKNNIGEMVMQLATGAEKDPVTGQLFQQGMSIPLFRWRQSYIIERFHFGEDSAESNRQKPVGWNTEGTPGYQQWQQHVNNTKASQATGYQGGDTFGLAKVGKVNGQLARKDAQTGQVIALGQQIVGQFTQPGQQFVNPNAPKLFNQQGQEVDQAGNILVANAGANVNVPAKLFNQQGQEVNAAGNIVGGGPVNTMGMPNLPGNAAQPGANTSYAGM